MPLAVGTCQKTVEALSPFPPPAVVGLSFSFLAGGRKGSPLSFSSLLSAILNQIVRCDETPSKTCDIYSPVPEAPSLPPLKMKPLSPCLYKICFLHSLNFYPSLPPDIHTGRYGRQAAGLRNSSVFLLYRDLFFFDRDERPPPFVPSFSVGLLPPLFHPSLPHSCVVISLFSLSQGRPDEQCLSVLPFQA